MATPKPAAGYLVGGGLCILAAIMAFEVATMDVPKVHAKVGPQIFPLATALALGLSGLGLVRSAAQSNFPEGEGSTQWLPVFLASLGILVMALLIKPLGFVLSAALLFMLVTKAFGSTNLLRDAAVGLALSLLTYIGFTKGLGLQLPPGVLAGLI
jgi:putative tricarboxylic transport membrane protein